MVMVVGGGIGAVEACQSGIKQATSSRLLLMLPAFSKEFASRRHLPRALCIPCPRFCNSRQSAKTSCARLWHTILASQSFPQSIFEIGATFGVYRLGPAINWPIEELVIICTMSLTLQLSGFLSCGRCKLMCVCRCL